MTPEPAHRFAGLHAAVSAIAAHCDGALSDDGVGFNGTDSAFGRRVAAMPVETWDDAIAVEVSRILPTYRNQLLGYGIDLREVELAQGPDRRHEARQVAREAARAVQWHPTAEVVAGAITVSSAMPVKDALKAAGFRFDVTTKNWTAPITLETAAAILAQPGITVADDAQSALAEATSKPAEPAWEVRVIDGNLALVTDFGRLPIDTVRQLPGRRWDATRKLNWVDPDPALLVLGLTVSPEALELIESGRAVAELRQAQEAELAVLSRATDSDAKVAFADRLRPFQRAGTAYALTVRRALIADDMGLGKTWQALSALETANAYPAVVVCPASLKRNWRREIIRLLPHRTIDVRSGRKSAGPAAADITIVNYDIAAAHAPALDGLAALVADESHYIKERTAQRTKAVKDLAAKVPGDGLVLFLTGTPVLNRPKELVEQLLALGHLTEERGAENSTGSFLFRYCGAVNTGYGWTFDGASNTAELNDWLRKTCMVRREKSQVLTDLPQKVRAPQFTELSASAQRRYAALEAEAASYAASTQAEQLVYLSKVREAVALAKIPQAVEWSQNFLTSGKSLVIFAHHKAVQEALISQLREAGHDVTHILGGQAGPDIEEHKARFQARESKVMVASLTAAREGHTLTAASDVLFTELPWTPGALAQAEDRCHRIGQEDSVTCWSLLAEDTVDEDMHELIAAKQQVVRAVVDGTDKPDTETGIAAELFARLLDRQAEKNQPEMEA